MPKSHIWMVRAGRGASYFDNFADEGVVAIGWPGVGEVSPDTDKAAIQDRLAKEYPLKSKGSISVWASQIKRFYSEIEIGDAVTTYDPNQRIYLLGQITSDTQNREHALTRARLVQWSQKVSRDVLLSSTRNTLGAISTLFLIQNGAANDMQNHAVAIDSQIPQTEAAIAPAESEENEQDIMKEVIAKAEEFIEDRIARLDWEQIQELVAEILIAMGYRARVSSKGPDRGHDIFASPDGLGLQEPRIFVEVKHRLGTPISANLLRSFLGGRQQGDRCLYVSTGGFTKDARYEAERSSIPITLITLPQLRELLIEHYESLRPTGTSLVPLERLYWPAH